MNTSVCTGHTGMLPVYSMSHSCSQPLSSFASQTFDLRLGFERSIHDHTSMYYNNFEMGSFKFFRSRQYQSYFQFLDSKGGFHHHR